MVNPNKHADKLNEADLEEIYNRLNQEYKRSREYTTKKDVNQEIIIFILACQRFTAEDIIRIPASFLKNVDKDNPLFEPVTRHIRNNYCELEGLLLTKKGKHPLNTEDVDKILSRIDTGKLDKRVSISTLNKTKSRFNNYGKKVLNKQLLRNNLKLREDLKNLEDKHKKEVLESQDNMISEDIACLNEKIDNLAEELKVYINESKSISNGDDSIKALKDITEKQEIIETSLTNKYNQLSSTVNKIHQKIKSSNNKYVQLNNNIIQLRDDINKEKEAGHNQEEDNAMDEVLAKLEKIESQITTTPTHQITTKEAPKNINKKDPADEVIPQEEYKDFMYKWFTSNMTLSKNPHDIVDMDNIISKLEKYLDKNDVQIDKTILFNRLESYLKYWYNSHDTQIHFRDIKSVDINNKEFYSNIKFIDFKVERENRIKNSIVTWLKENTREANAAKTYTQDIFDKIQPIFEDNGWIITDSYQWKKLHDAGYTKVCSNRTFSQLIGKSVLEVYKTVKTLRDTPTISGNVTWYSNIEIIEKELSDNVNSIIKDELSNVIFEGENIIHKWLKDNLKYTGNVNDVTRKENIQKKLGEYLNQEEMDISEEVLAKIMDNLLEEYLKEYDIKINTRGISVTCFRLKDESSKKVRNIITTWMDNHIVKGSEADMLYVNTIKEKVLSHLYWENITVVPDKLYSQLDQSIRDTFIPESEFEEDIKVELSEKIKNPLLEDSIEGYYYQSYKYIKYNTLKEEQLTQWINDKIEDLLKNNVVNKKAIIEEFKEYMKEHNLVNKSEYSTSELLTESIRKHYDNTSLLLKEVSDAENEYYILV